MIRAVAYYRKSNDEGDERGKSIKQQRGDLVPACEAAGLVVVREFDDQGVPGWATEKRDGFKAMLAFCQEQDRLGQPIEVIACWSADRFSRSDSDETGGFVWQFRQAGVGRMFTVDEGWIDLTDPTARAVFGLKQDLGRAAYVRDLAKKVRRGKKHAAADGLFPGGKAPYGYQLEPVQVGRKWKSRLVPHPTEADVVRRLFETYADTTVSLRGLVDQLRQDEVPSPTGKPLWIPTTVARVLSNVLYLGNAVYGRKSYGRYAGAVRVKAGKKLAESTGLATPEADWVRKDRTHEPLVPPELFDRVQKRLAANQGKKGTRKTAPFVLAGLLVCGKCGKRMVGQTGVTARNGKRHKYRLYTCASYHLNGSASGCHRNTVEECRMLRAVVGKVAGGFDSPDAEAAVRDALRQQEQDAAGSADRVRELEARERELDRKVGNLIDRLGDDLPDAVLADVRDRIKTVSADRDAVRAELARVRAAAVAVEDVDARADRAIAQLRRLKAAARKGDPAALSALLREAVDRVEVFFTTRRVNVRTRAEFARGLVYLNPAAWLPPVIAGMEPASSRSC